MITDIYIYTASDAFLYLPVYIAKELKIFKSLIKDDSVNIIFPDVKVEGDIIAIQEMLKMNEKAIHETRRNIIPICISDPTVFLSKKMDKNYNSNQCVVIGALINKIPFWAVDRDHTHYDEFDQLCTEFTDVVHYDKQLITGYHLGKRFLNQNENCVSHIAPKVGSEFQVMNDTYQMYYEQGEKNKKVVAITADIVSVVKGLIEKDINPESKFSVNYYFSKENESLLSTGILTTKHIISKKGNHDLIAKIIEGIQKSISFIESSEDIATDICLRVASEKKIASIDRKVAEKIIEKMNDENFYPADLNIHKNEWINSINALADIENWSPSIKASQIANSFDNHVNDIFLKKSLLRISDQFGITKEIFREDINKEVEMAITPLVSELKEVKEKYSVFEKWDKLTIFMGKCQVSIFDFFKRPFISKKWYKKLLIWITIVAIIGSILTILFKGYNIHPEYLRTYDMVQGLSLLVLSIIFGLPTFLDLMKKIFKNG